MGNNLKKALKCLPALYNVWISRASPQNLSTMERKDWKCCRIGSLRRKERRGTKLPGHHAVWKATKNSPVCKGQGLHFTQDFTKEDRQAREQLWPKSSRLDRCLRWHSTKAKCHFMVFTVILESWF